MANKMKCLIQRRHSHDLYDFVYATFFDHGITFDRTLIASTFLKKTIFERSPGSAKQILLGLPTVFFKSVWDKYIVCPVMSRLDFDTAYASFIETIEARQGLKVACLEEIALRMGYITADDVRRVAESMASNQYGEYLLRLLESDITRC